MRDHGDSPKTSTMSHDSNVRDLENFLRKLKKPSVLVGHSLGGTAAIDLAFKQPNLVKELIMIDISPLKYPEKEEDYGLNVCNETKRLILKLSTITNQVEDISIIKEEFNKSIMSPSLSKIMCSNLDKHGENWRCKVNIEPIEKMGKLKAMRKVYPLRGKFEGRCLLIHSDSSGYVVPGCDYEVLKTTFPKIKIVCLKNCSHWIHVDMPRELTYYIIQHLNRNSVTAH
ncbi:protein ABHD11-like [Centruroides sculpturatus]|uniref:protein ABHD11-like n=1 Tax=Centruroides sculpturatus TaxID=218467 RepID=UPI000C6DB45C|nr:protein ABHD11-like [Centruroides sculpturatus]